MPFCRRCGEIVVATNLCKCGGTAVAPVVHWKESAINGKYQDQWSKTYVERQQSASPSRPQQNPNSPPQTSKRFSLPLHSLPSSESKHSARLPSRVDHNTVSSSTIIAKSQHDSEPDVLPSIDPNDTTLSKVYGSILQPPESIETQSCAICSIPFPPDATLYPDPSLPSTPRYLCRPCFEVNGGSKGTCPACLRPVLTLKSEGGFVHASGKFWHKRCFNCFGCQKNIGNAPMIDLFGRPSCSSCFDVCLKAGGPSGSKSSFNASKELVSMRSSRDERKTDPAVVDELKRRLGITKDTEAGPDNLRQKLPTVAQGRVDRSSIDRYSNEGKGRPNQYSYQRHLIEGIPMLPETVQSKGDSNLQPSPPHSVISSKREAIEEVKRRFLRRSMMSPSTSTTTDTSIPGNSLLISRSSKMPPTQKNPVSEISKLTVDTSIGNISPELSSTEDINNFASGKREKLSFDQFNGQATSSSINASHSSNPQGERKLPDSWDPAFSEQAFPSSCFQCHKEIFISGKGGNYVTIPSDETRQSTLVYHVHCFQCVVCRGLFEETRFGKAAFVKVDGGPCHVECAPPPAGKVTPKLSCDLGRYGTSFSSLSLSAPNSERGTFHSSQKSSSRLERPSNSISPVTTPTRRFGNTTLCPGCKTAVYQMEHGVVPGPQGTRWHTSCLVCGGKRRSTTSGVERARQENGNGGSGCGKRLDSAARCIGDGSVWCRECLLLLGIKGSSIQGDGIPLQAGSGDVNNVLPQLTGTTTLARQFTGLGGAEPVISAQLTGGLNPTRTLSTHATTSLGTPRPRAKSTIGIRGSKGVDESRVKLLVRQMTGRSEC